MRYGNAGTRTGAAGHDLGIDGVLWQGEGRADANKASCELVKIGLADQDRPGITQQADDKGIRFRIIGKIRAGCCRGQAGGVDIVLDHKGNTPERLCDRVEGTKLLCRRDGCVPVDQVQKDARVADGVDSSESLRHDIAWLNTGPVGIMQVPEREGKGL